MQDFDLPKFYPKVCPKKFTILQEKKGRSTRMKAAGINNNQQQNNLGMRPHPLHPQLLRHRRL